MGKITIFTHGTAKENPGPAAIGVFIIDSKGKVLKEVSEGIGNATKDYADYYAIIVGLQSVVDLFGEKTKDMEFELKLDNELVKKQLNAEEQIKEIGLVGHFIQIYNIKVANFPNIKITFLKSELYKKAMRVANKDVDG